MSDFTPETLTPESNMRVISCIKFRIFKGFEMRPALPSAPNPAQIMVQVYKLSGTASLSKILRQFVLVHFSVGKRGVLGIIAHFPPLTSARLDCFQ